MVRLEKQRAETLIAHARLEAERESVSSNLADLEKEHQFLEEEANALEGRCGKFLNRFVAAQKERAQDMRGLRAVKKVLESGMK